jgi:hypothetical protein
MKEFHMPAPTTVTALVIRIQESFERFLQATAPLREDELLEPRLQGGWSVKDVLAHLAWWDQWLLYTIPLKDQSGPARRPPPLFDEIPIDGRWADRMNARVYEFNRTRELSEIQAESEAARRDVLQLVQSFSDTDVFDAEGLSAVLGQPAAPLLLGIYEHYEEHAHAIERLYN